MIVIEVEMVYKVCENFEGMDLVCMVNFGIEVIMMVICLVRGYIGCDKIVKFEGCYYGYVDLLLVKVGFGVLILGVFNFFGVFESLV